MKKFISFVLSLVTVASLYAEPAYVAKNPAGQPVTLNVDGSGNLMTTGGGGGGGGSGGVVSGTVSIGNWPSTQAVTITSGTVTANIGSLNGIATSANQATSNGYLSSIAAATTGTVSLGNLNGASTAANQVTSITALNQLHTDLAAPTPSGTNTIGSVIITDSSGNAAAVSTSVVDATPTVVNRLRTTSILHGYNGTTLDLLRSGFSGIVTSSTGFLNTMWKGKYTAAGLSLTDGQWADPSFDSSGNLEVNIQSSKAVPTSDSGALLTSTLAITGVQTTSAIPVAGYNTVNVVAWGTFAGVNVTPQISPDGGTTWTGVLLTRQDATTSAAALTTGVQAVSHSYSFPTLGATHVRFNATAWTSGQENLRVTPALVSPPQSYLTTSYNGTQAVTIAANSSVNLAQVNGSIPNTNVAQGSTNKANGVIISGATTSAYATTAFAGNGALNGASSAVADGGGVSSAFDINVTATTLGTATSVIFVIQDSYDNGTTYNDVWVCQPITGNGHIRVPAIPLHGRWRVRAWSIGGTSTTVTATVTPMAIGTEVLVIRQFVDVYAATNPFNSMQNGTSVASTLVSTVANTNANATNSCSAVANIEGCKNITITGVFTAGLPTTAPVYTLAISQDGTNWSYTTCTMTPGTTANGTYTGSISGISARFAKVAVTTASSGGTAYTCSYVAINGTN